MPTDEDTGEILIVQHDDRRIWPIAVSVGASVLSAILAAALSFMVAARAQESGRKATCEIVRTQIAIYAAEPPSTDTGREAHKAWEQAYSRWRCEEIPE